MLICDSLHDIIIHPSIQTCVHCPVRLRIETDGNSPYFLLTHNCMRLHYLSSVMSHVWNTIQTEQYKPSLSSSHVAPSLPCDHHALSMVLTDRKHNKQPSIYRRCLSVLRCSWSITWLEFLSEMNSIFESYFWKYQLCWEPKKGDLKKDVGVCVWFLVPTSDFLWQSGGAFVYLFVKESVHRCVYLLQCVPQNGCDTIRELN